MVNKQIFYYIYIKFIYGPFKILYVNKLYITHFN